MSDLRLSIFFVINLFDLGGKEILKKKGYKVKEIDAKGCFVDKLKKINPKVVFNALHGKYGEDGFTQAILESINIPYTHSGVLSSSLAMDKALSRNIFKKNKIKWLGGDWV